MKKCTYIVLIYIIYKNNFKVMKEPVMKEPAFSMPTDPALSQLVPKKYITFKITTILDLFQISFYAAAKPNICTN